MKRLGTAGMVAVALMSVIATIGCGPPAPPSLSPPSIPGPPSVPGPVQPPAVPKPW